MIKIAHSPDSWNSVGLQLEKGEPATIDVDNSDDWHMFSFCPKFKEINNVMKYT